MKIEDIKAYELIDRRAVDDLYSEGYLLRHKKSGARVFILENDDENKVFSIGFRTPPSDSTGVPHIMEHSVLCGSDKFPAKDPFVELAKGSLNTFLNAMTYPDKTVYPVASCNDKDFKNLMHVYMDAVFHPNIYKRPQIFKQEGWHYELSSKDEPITINGVVYNEMKGAFSSPEDVVDRKLFEALYPDTAYALESGGDPEVIPQLSYEQFLDFHRKYYHPVNSYIYLYGNCDMAERLAWLDEEYLSNYEMISIDSCIGVQKPFDKMKEVEFDYSITEEEELCDNTYLSYGCVIDTALNKEYYLAFQVLEYALLDAPGAPLKEALIKSKIGLDVLTTYENGILQPFFSIMVKNANREDKDRFVETIKSVLSDICEKGIDKKALQAGINYFEFKYREADFGSYPKGLMYGLQAYDSWLYDETNPYMHISATKTIDFLKSKIGSDYYEELIKKYLIDNNHSVLVIANPKRGLTEEKEEALSLKLKEFKKSLSDEELDALIKDTRDLKMYQSEPSTKEELESIPLLEISDIKKNVEPYMNEKISDDGVEYLFHEVKSNGIGYLTLVFDITGLDEELIPYMALAKSLMGLISTDNYDYTELTNEINRQSGGIGAAINVTSRKTEKYESSLVSTFEMEGKMLAEKTGFVFEMMEEILFSSKFDSYDRIHELMTMIRSKLQMAMMSSGHTVAALRAMSHVSQTARYSDIIGGIEYYRFVDKLLRNWDEVCVETKDKMQKAISHALSKNLLLVDFAGERNSFELIKPYAKHLVGRLNDVARRERPGEFTLSEKNEGFRASSQVQYVAMAGNYKKSGLAYSGALKVLKCIMGYDYLWINVRVKGGAYGCMTRYKMDGDSYFVSYRDPHIKETIDIYKNAADYIRSFNPSERDMAKYIIGTISDVDIPLTAKMKGDRSLSAYIAGKTIEDAQKERDEILSANVDSIRALADHIAAVVDDNNLCVVGAEGCINDNADLFDEVCNLY